MNSSAIEPMALAYRDETKPQVGDILFDHTTGREVIVCEVRRAALAVRELSVVEIWRADRVRHTTPNRRLDS